jgi:hypothetical protein
MSIVTKDGQTFETRNLTYDYYDGEPCKITDMRGDFDAYKRTDTVLLHAQRLGGGWVRYWTTSTDMAERQSLARIAYALLGK